MHVSVASQRSWTLFKRYSDFVELDRDLKTDEGLAGAKQPLPASLPPKHAWSSTFGPIKNPAVLEDRRAGLELYLRTLVSHKDDAWRQSPVLLRFLEVPLSKASHLPSDFTSASWLDEHDALQSTVKDIRALLSKRDALVSRGQDAAEARKASVEAKTLLAGLVASLTKLSAGLDSLASQGLAQAELRRRTDLVTDLQDEVETLGKVASSSARITAASKGNSSSSRPGQQHLAAASGSSEPPSAARVDLLGPAAAASGPRALGRKIGAPVETEQTRPLDNQGLLQLQQQEMDAQDSRLSDISAILRRQRFLGEEIDRELRLHNEELDGLNQEVDQTTDKMGKVRQKIKRFVHFPFKQRWPLPISKACSFFRLG